MTGYIRVQQIRSPIRRHYSQRLTLKGTVSLVKWQNPHVLIYIDVPDETGKLVTWGFENSNVHTLATQGYNRNTLKIGQPVTAIVNPSVNGEPLGIIVKVVLADGKEIMSRERGNVREQQRNRVDASPRGCHRSQKSEVVEGPFAHNGDDGPWPT